MNFRILPSRRPSSNQFFLRVSFALLTPLCCTLFLSACTVSSDEDSNDSNCGPSISSLINSADFGVRTLSSSLGGTRLAQSFTTTSALNIVSADLGLNRIGTPTNSKLTLKLLPSADLSGSAPSETPVTADATAELTVSTTATSETISTSSEFYTFTFNGTVPLEADTVYWLVLSASYPANDTSYINWTYQSGELTSGKSLWESQFFPIQWLSLTDTSADFNFMLKCATTPSPTPSPSTSTLLSPLAAPRANP